MTDKEKLTDLVSRSAFYRGTILTEWIHLEKYIEHFILQYFTQDIEKQIELAQLLLDRLGFESKRQVFTTILNKKSELSGFVKTKRNSYPHKNLIEELKRINIEWNYFSHYIIDYSEQAIELKDEQITLLEFRDKTTKKVYTDANYQNLWDRMQKAAREIMEMTPL